jgi:Xaa-Pro aminopeptidase
MQYSPDCDIPYISIVDAGIVELVRKAGGVEVVSSADLVSRFEAVFGEEGEASHKRAMDTVHSVRKEAFAKIGAAVAAGEELTEYQIAMFILDRFEQEGLDADGHIPIVGVNEHPADPHFEPTSENTFNFGMDQTLLIDLWAREKPPTSIFADITWCGYIGENPPEEYVRMWQIVCDARDAGCELAIEKFEKNETVEGWEIDDATRKVINDAGYGDYFIHRTGHSIGFEVHGNGANIDNFETRDRRRILPGTCFSIEPGLYLEGKMAVRTEVDVLISPDGKAEVTGEIQKDLIMLP